MNDITALAQTEINDALAQLKQLSEYPTPSTQYARVLRKYITSLVEALEKAQQYAKERDEENQSLMLTVGRLRVERESLESRTVTVKLPELCVGVVQGGHAVMVPYAAGHWFNKTAILEMLAAAGIQVIEGDA
ncbi:hypothetical protein RIN60_05815 [Kluyvera cryocrescens]|uniref:hypothetical protein n=1 Tax=Kluyvera cryocrescens TaxID=580 RepID=UPI0028BD8E76|nr:hypothetical protein [Kluyvera cryocrescens]WNN72865.1 hypothetical protein RIN60_05815 [Kluyvera cryocrescens]